MEAELNRQRKSANLHEICKEPQDKTMEFLLLKGLKAFYPSYGPI